MTKDVVRANVLVAAAKIAAVAGICGLLVWLAMPAVRAWNAERKAKAAYDVADVFAKAQPGDQAGAETRFAAVAATYGATRWGQAAADQCRALRTAMKAEARQEVEAALPQVQNRVRSLLRGRRFTEASAAVKEFREAHDKGLAAELAGERAGPLDAEIRRDVRARWETLVRDADSAMSRLDLAAARRLLVEARQLDVVDAAPDMERRLALLSQVETDWARWHAVQDRAMGLAREGRQADALAELASARELRLPGMGELLQTQTAVVLRVATRTAGQTRAAYARQSEELWRLFRQRRFTEALDLANGLTANPALAAVGDAVQADVAAAQLLAEFWRQVVAEPAQGGGAPTGEALERAVQSALRRAGADTEVRRRPMAVLFHIASGTELAAAAADLDQLPPQPHTPFWRERLDTAVAGASEEDAATAWRGIARQARERQTAETATATLARLDDFDARWGETKVGLLVFEEEEATRHRLRQAAALPAGATADPVISMYTVTDGEWATLFDGRTLAGWQLNVTAGVMGQPPPGADNTVPGPAQATDESPSAEPVAPAAPPTVPFLEGGAAVLPGRGAGVANALSSMAWSEPGPRSDYEISFEAGRLTPQDSLPALVFPLPASSCLWRLDTTSGSSGLELVDGQPAHANGTTAPLTVDVGKWVTCRVRVAGDRVSAFADERQVADVQLGHGVGLPPGRQHLLPLAFLSAASEGAVRDIRIRSVAPGAEGPPEAGWESIFDGTSLDGWEPLGDGPDQPGNADVVDGCVVLGTGEPLTAIRWTGQPELPRVNYELAFEASRRGGLADFASVVFPVGEGYTCWSVGGWIHLSALDTLDGRPGSRNASTRQIAWENGRWYSMRLRVDEERLRAWVDGEAVFDVPLGHWLTLGAQHPGDGPEQLRGPSPTSHLSLLAASAEAGRLALVAGEGTARVRSVRVRRLSGTGEPLLPEPGVEGFLSVPTAVLRPVDEWQNTGLDLRQGARYDALATGASGWLDGLTPESLPTSAFSLCLSGRIGLTGSPFLIDGRLVFTAPAAGRLFVRLDSLGPDARWGRCLLLAVRGPCGVDPVAPLLGDFVRVLKRLSWSGMGDWVDSGVRLSRGQQALITMAGPAAPRQGSGPGGDLPPDLYARNQMMTAAAQRGSGPGGDLRPVARPVRALAVRQATPVIVGRGGLYEAEEDGEVQLAMVARREPGTDTTVRAVVWGLVPGLQSSAAEPWPPGEGWRPLFSGTDLDGWRVTGERMFATHGPVTVDRGRILLGAGQTQTGVTCTRAVPQINYELAFEAMRTQGSADFCNVAFQAGDEPYMLKVGGWGGVVALDGVDGRTDRDSTTTTRPLLRNLRWYQFRLRVTEASVRLWLDEEPVLELSRGGHRVAFWQEYQPLLPLGFATWQTESAIRCVMVRDLLPAEADCPLLLSSRRSGAGLRVTVENLDSMPYAFDLRYQLIGHDEVPLSEQTLVTGAELPAGGSVAYPVSLPPEPQRPGHTVRCVLTTQEGLSVQEVFRITRRIGALGPREQGGTLVR